ncbi:MAG: phosphatase PAP2 family protein, partial [Patescibacteria group bacterium]
VITATLSGLTLKSLIHAPRPFLALPQVQALFPESGYAFPSGHATFFSAMAFTIFFRNKKAGYVFILFALLIGLTRIIAGVHFPIDILGGFILGSAIAYFFKNI